MELNKQRIDGAKAAQSAKAEKTLQVINDEKSNYETILKTAVEEAGIDAVVQYCLKGDPELAYQALLHIQNLDSYREALVKKAAESPDHAALTLRNIPQLEKSHQDLLSANVGEFGTPLGDISGFNLHNGGGYVAQFTMYWVDNGIQYPQKGKKRKWSGRILLGQNKTQLCNFFPEEGVPLAPGNQVWMYLYVQAGCDKETPFRFTYNPNSPNLAYFSCTGTTTSASLSLNRIAAASQAIVTS